MCVRVYVCVFLTVNKNNEPKRELARQPFGDWIFPRERKTRVYAYVRGNRCVKAKSYRKSISSPFPENRLLNCMLVKICKVSCTHYTRANKQTKKVKQIKVQGKRNNLINSDGLCRGKCGLMASLKDILLSPTLWSLRSRS